MEKKKFGIISGAGPMAGVLLYRLVIKKLQTKGFWHDYDFPHIVLVNVPFSEMLSGETENAQVRNELIDALQFLSRVVDHSYIACQTLHAFLNSSEMSKYKVVSLISLIKDQIKHKDGIKVVASKTSRLSNLHSKELNFDCEYIENEKSEKSIEEILRGNPVDLAWLNKLSSKNNIILGCTEFSVALENSNANFIDPIELAAEDIVSKFT